MIKVLEVELTPRAAAQIERAATWWAENRPAAPDAIRVDFQEARSLLSRQPGVGAKSRTRRYPDLRRLFFLLVLRQVPHPRSPDADEAQALIRANEALTRDLNRVKDLDCGRDNTEIMTVYPGPVSTRSPACVGEWPPARGSSRQPGAAP